MKEPRCVVCNKTSDELIPISSALNIYTCDRHWGWSWAISFLLFIVGGTIVSVTVLAEPASGLRTLKCALILFAMPWMVWAFLRSLRVRRVVIAERAAMEEEARCQGEPIAPSRDVDRAER